MVATMNLTTLIDNLYQAQEYMNSSKCENLKVCIYKAIMQICKSEVKSDVGNDLIVGKIKINRKGLKWCTRFRLLSDSHQINN